MNHICLWLTRAALCMLMGLGAGCGSDDSDNAVVMRSCVDVCKDGQAGQCTTVKGDCSAFCGALERTAPTANCASQRTNYLKCLSAGPVCAQSCNSTDNALTTCINQYCIQHTSDADCATLVSSF